MGPWQIQFRLVKFRVVIRDAGYDEDMMKILDDKGYKAMVKYVGQYINSQTHDALAEEHRQIEEENPLLAPHSCPHCRKLQLDLRPTLADHVYDNQDWTSHDRETSFTLADAKMAGNHGCYFFHHLDPFAQWLDTISAGERRKDMFLTVTIIMGAHARVRFHESSGINKFGMYNTAGNSPPSSFLLGQLPPNLLPNSPLSFNRIRGWTGECTEGHIKCQEFSASFIPKRLLQVSGDEEMPTVRLSMHHHQAKYATLSYCWGGPQEAETTSENVNEYEKGVPFDRLPKTTQDAVIVTRGIGLSYLWVDALCIIQDDNRDKEEQISQMDRIFRGSFITIAAVDAASSAVGFLHPRKHPHPTTLRARFDYNGFSDIVLSPKVQWPDEYEQGRLFTRGWTFQETQLSTRILLYTSRQLTYTCIEAMHSDGGVEPKRNDVARFVDPGQRVYAAMEHPYSWGAMLQAYSSRQLTLDDDKLLGIAALAAEYSRTRDVGHYYAGLWERDFLTQCIWQPHKASKRRIRKKGRAPSWSWASLDCAIHDGFNSIVSTSDTGSSFEAFKITCELVDVHTTLITPENPFGRVKNGFIVLRGKMRRVACFGAGRRVGGFGVPGRIVSDEDSDGSDEESDEADEESDEADQESDETVEMVYRHPIPYSPPGGISCFLDVPDEWRGKDPVFWGIEISEGMGGMKWRGGSRMTQTCLLLRKKKNRPATFERVGLVFLFDRYADKYPYQWTEITII